MRKTILMFSFVLMFAGLTIGYVYANPFGFVIDGIGFVLFLYAIFARQKEPRFHSREQYLKTTLQDSSISQKNQKIHLSDKGYASALGMD